MLLTSEPNLSYIVKIQNNVEVEIDRFILTVEFLDVKVD